MEIEGCENPPHCRTNNGLISYVKTHEISKNIIKAMQKVNRCDFIPKQMTQSRKHAYYDTPLSIGYNVTISQPSLVAKMLDYLQIESINNILELGTGSGYNAAIISELIPYGKLTTVERITSLGRHAKTILKNRKNIEVITGDAMTIKYKHPFDRIIITAEFLSEDDVNDMIDNLAASYSICIYPYKNILWRVVKCNGDIIDKSKLLGVRFVPVLHN